MLAFRFESRCDPVNASYAERGFLHPDYRVIFCYTKGVVIDDALYLTRLQRSVRPGLLLLLEGHGRARVEGRECELHPGALVTTSTFGTLGMRLEPGALAMIVTWRAGTVGAQLHADLDGDRISQTDLKRLAAMHTALVIGHERVDVGAASQVGALLSALGVPLDPIDPGYIGAPVPLSLALAGRALGACLSELDRVPNLAHVVEAAGFSERQMRRAFTELARYGMNGGENWRSMLATARLCIACGLTSAPGATTEVISRAVGYGAPAALCHAFANAGLPSPAEVGRRLKTL